MRLMKNISVFCRDRADPDHSQPLKRRSGLSGESRKVFSKNFLFLQEKEQAGKALSKVRPGKNGGHFLRNIKNEAEARIRETVQAEGVICSQAEVEIEKDEKSGEYGTIRKIILHLKEEK